MNKIKKKCGIVLSVSMMLASIQPVCVWGTDEVSDGFVVEDGVLVEYSGSGGEIVIPNGVVEIGSCVFYNKDDITNIVFPESLTRIQMQAFLDCDGITTLSFPDSLEMIGQNAFQDCDNIEAVKFPENIEIKDSAFWNCIGIKELNMPKGVTFGRQVFNGCTGLESFTFPEDAEVITEGILYGCSNLKSVTLPAGVKDIQDAAFHSCSSLTSIEIPDTVTNIGEGAFGGCEALTEITLPDGVRTLSRNLFSRCLKLETINYSNQLTEIGYCAFENCQSLKTITIPAGVSNLTTPDSGLYGTGTFYGCSSLTEIQVDENNPLYMDREGVLYSKNGANLIFYPSAHGDNYVVPEDTTWINARAFACNDKLISLTMPECVGGVGDEALRDCTALTNLIFENEEISLGTDALKGCTSLTSYTKGSEIVSMDSYLFDIDENGRLRSYRGQAEKVTIPETVNTIGKEAFRDNHNVKKVIIPDSVLIIEDEAFEGCTELNDISLSGNIKEIGKGVFWNCTSLTSIVFPASLEKIGIYAFNRTNCRTFTFLGESVSMEPGSLAWYDIEDSSDGRTYPTDITVRGIKESSAETVAKRLSWTFETLDGTETTDYSEAIGCEEVTLGLINAYLDFLTENYLTKYPELALGRFQCSESEHEFFKNLVQVIISENSDKTIPMALYDWMNDNIGSYKGIEMGYPMDVYNYKTADCLGNAYLLCELLRCADIPAVVATGYGGDMVSTINENQIFSNRMC